MGTLYQITLNMLRSNHGFIVSPHQSFVASLKGNDITFESLN